jgi:DNA polymerase (family 10)
MRERAIAQGMSLNEYALTRDGQPVAGATEEEVFEALGLAWVPPELREDRGELNLAERHYKAADAIGGLPLVQLTDIRAELHTHTTASDGRWSIEENARAAAARGFHTVAITDHSKGQAQANGLSEDRLVKHIEAVRAVAKKLEGTITVLAGSEVDILASGDLDYPDDLLAELDIVVASPHAALSQEPAKATKRLLKAIENPYVTILGHPTGRIVNRREGLSPDMEALFKAAKDRGIALEINASPYRLDLRDTHARAWVQDHGGKLAINTDAHAEAHLDNLRFGVLTAKRAGATKDDVVNGLSKAALAKWIASTRPS